MVRQALIACCGLWALSVSAQYPLTRSFTAMDGQQGVRTTCLAQDVQGLIWLGGEAGLYRTDGDRTEAMLRTEGASVTALCATPQGMVAALASGHIVRCDGGRCDTLLVDSLYSTAFVRAMVVDDGTIWLGTYGAGLHMLSGTSISARITTEQGLNDDHVNALVRMVDGSIAVATDQGIAIVAGQGKSITSFGEAQGAPDNLVLSLCVNERGEVWAGGDRGGPFGFRPGDRTLLRADTAWYSGPVVRCAAAGGKLWSAIPGRGVVVLDTTAGRALYTSTAAEQGATSTVTDLLCDAEGGVWWCDGTSTVRRADPYVLITTMHEGVDMRRITAISTAGRGRIAVAVGHRAFVHSSTFAEEHRLRALQLPIDSLTPVVAMGEGPGGDLWAGTFGRGLYHLRSTVAEPALVGSARASVLAVNADAMAVHAATIGGVWKVDANDDEQVLDIPGNRFTYDVQPLRDGRVFVATDGDGVLRIDPNGRTVQLRQAASVKRTFYSLCADARGMVWAVGPGTGLTYVRGDSLVTVGAGGVARMNDVYALVASGTSVLLFGDAGVRVFDPLTGVWDDRTDELGLRGAKGELNAADQDPDGSIWLATDRGLYHLSARRGIAGERPHAVILSVSQGGAMLPWSAGVLLPAARDFLTVRFTGLHYAAPEDVRFFYRLIGADTAWRATRDREISFSHIAAGDYRFEVAAGTVAGPARAAVAGFDLHVSLPWWRTPWAIAAACVIGALLTILLIRARDARRSARDRAEREKARFQMQVLRSQVNPHFLFNSFNTLIELIEETPEKAVTHVEQLSDFFREILKVRDKELIPLREEMVLVDTYFRLEQRRFGDRVRSETDLPEEAMNCLVPPLTVQLLVENALKHNRASDDEPLTVRIGAARGTLSVVNSFRPRTEAARSTGFGIASIRQRFEAITTKPVVIGREGDTFAARIPLLSPHHEDPDR